MAYVPSRKKIKRGDKPPDEPIHKNDSKSSRTGSPPPSSPHTPIVRQTFAHPAQSGSHQPTNIVRASNPSAVFSGQVQYQPEFRQPAAPVVNSLPFAQPLPQQVRYGKLINFLTIN